MAGPVEAQHSLVAVVQRGHELERVPRHQQPPQRLQRAGDVALVDGVVELPGHHRPGPLPQRGHIGGGDGRPGAEHALQGADQPHHPAAVLAEQVGDGGRCAPVEVQAGEGELIPEPLPRLSGSGGRHHVHHPAPGRLHCLPQRLGQGGETALHLGVDPPLPGQHQVGGGQLFGQQVHQDGVLGLAAEPGQMTADHHPPVGQERRSPGRDGQRGQRPVPLGVPQFGLCELLHHQTAVARPHQFAHQGGDRLGHQHRVVPDDDLKFHSPRQHRGESTGPRRQAPDQRRSAPDQRTGRDSDTAIGGTQARSEPAPS